MRRREEVRKEGIKKKQYKKGFSGLLKENMVAKAGEIQ